VIWKKSEIHLTNIAVQKRSDDYDPDSGSKWNLRALKLYMISKHGHERVDRLFCDIQLLCIRSLMSVQNVIINDRNSFELYGFDVMIDSDLKAWLIEINSAPSLTANTPEDYQMKFTMLEDSVNIVDMEGKLAGDEDQIGGFDLIYRNGFVRFDPNCTCTTYLGCHNNRDRQLRKLYKTAKKKKKEQVDVSKATSENEKPVASSQ